MEFSSLELGCGLSLFSGHVECLHSGCFNGITYQFCRLNFFSLISLRVIGFIFLHLCVLGSFSGMPGIVNFTEISNRGCVFV